MEKDDKIRHSDKLSEKQHIALMAIFSGATDEKAGEAAGISRQTVNNWRRKDAVFMATIKNKQAELWHEHRQNLRGSLAAALKTIDAAIKAGDVKVALWLLERASIEVYLKHELDKIEVYETTVEREKEHINCEKERIKNEAASRMKMARLIDSF